MPEEQPVTTRGEVRGVGLVGRGGLLNQTALGGRL